MSPSNPCLICNATTKSTLTTSAIEFISNLMVKFISFPQTCGGMISSNSSTEGDNKIWHSSHQKEAYYQDYFKHYSYYCQKCLYTIRTISLMLKRLDHLQQQLTRFQQKFSQVIHDHIDQIEAESENLDLNLYRFREKIVNELDSHLDSRSQSTSQLDWNLASGQFSPGINNRMTPNYVIEAASAYVQLTRLEDLQRPNSPNASGSQVEYEEVEALPKRVCVQNSILTDTSDMVSEQDDDQSYIDASDPLDDHSNDADFLPPIEDCESEPEEFSNSFTLTKVQKQPKRRYGAFAYFRRKRLEDAHQENSGAKKRRVTVKYVEELISLQCKFPECQFVGIGKFQLSSHVLEVHWDNANSDSIERNLCRDCGAACQSSEELNEHGLTHIDKYLYGCKYCPVRYIYASSLWKHNIGNHRKEYYRDRRTLSSTVSNVPQQDYDGVMLTADENEKKPAVLQKIKQKNTSNKLHQKTNSKTVFPKSSPQCSKICNTVSSISSHRIRLIRHQKPANLLIFKRKPRHHEPANRLIVKRKPREKEPKPESYMCEHCGKCFKDRKPYMGHVKCHRKQIKCPNCTTDPPRSFASKKGLEYHQIKDHPELNMPRYQCPHCGKMLGRVESLAYHIKNFHTSERRNFECLVPGCNFSAIQPSKLAVHARVHNNERNFPCTLCEAKFHTKSALNIHLKIHTGVKPFICQYCSKGFSRNDKMKIHKATHESARPFSCELCGLTFPTKNNLNGHMRSHHKNKGAGAGVKPTRKSKYNDPTKVAGQ